MAAYLKREDDGIAYPTIATFRRVPYSMVRRAFLLTALALAGCAAVDSEPDAGAPEPARIWYEPGNVDVLEYAMSLDYLPDGQDMRQARAECAREVSDDGFIARESMGRSVYEDAMRRIKLRMRACMEARRFQRAE